jgi:hypothetical protein
MPILNNGGGHIDMKKAVRMFAKAAITLGVILWVGALSPEIFVKPGKGCIVDSSGEELDQEKSREFLKSYFYGKDDDFGIKLKYSFAILDFITND